MKRKLRIVGGQWQVSPVNSDARSTQANVRVVAAGLGMKDLPVVAR